MKQWARKCLCEAIAYKVTEELSPIYNCHCSKCRRWHAAALRTRAAVERKNFTWLTGEAQLSQYSYGNVTKSFYSICGSSLISWFKDNNFFGLLLGRLKQAPHTSFVGSKSLWYEMTNGLPQYETWAPGGSTAVRTGKE